MKLNITAFPPKTAKISKIITQHGRTRDDEYDWMRAENWQNVMSDPSVLPTNIRNHLEAENSYYEEVTAPIKPLADEIFEEMKGRIEPTESDVPTPDGNYAYFHTYREGDQYGVYKRAKLLNRGTLELGPDDILLDADLLKKDYPSYFDLGGVEHSPDHKYVAYTLDDQGAENYKICLLYTSPSPRDQRGSRMPSSA